MRTRASISGTIAWGFAAGGVWDCRVIGARAPAARGRRLSCRFAYSTALTDTPVPSAREPAMSAFDRIAEFHPELTRWRRDIHAHPELGFQETRTADLVAAKLEAFGIEVHRGVGKTGVLGVLRAGSGAGRIGLRADMDALPIEEANTFAHCSTHKGVMHACGHDGHTTMLLGAARYLARRGVSRDGELHLPARRGRYRRRPCDGRRWTLAALSVRLDLRYAQPAELRRRDIRDQAGPMMAGGAFFDIHVTGRVRTAHGRKPESIRRCRRHITVALQSSYRAMLRRSIPRSCRDQVSTPATPTT